MYIRFVVGADDDNHRHLTGVITEARMLSEQGNLEDYEEEIIQNAFDWLNQEVPCPPFDTAKWPINVVCWFKSATPEAQDAIKLMRSLALVLKNHGKTVRTLKSSNPGKVYYEDDFQVVVEDFKTLPKIGRMR